MIGLPKLIPDTHTQLPPFVLQVLAAVVELQVLAAVVGGSGGLCPEWGEGKPLFGTRPEVCYR